MDKLIRKSQSPYGLHQWQKQIVSTAHFFSYVAVLHSRVDHQSNVLTTGSASVLCNVDTL